jgi:UDP-hydrolysing UDP-N-acetyl-D-glucosamine 2-epimerase
LDETGSENIMTKRKIAFYSGNRAEYGLQYPILQVAEADPRIDSYLIISGSHTQEGFGKTRKEIENDGINIYKEIKMDISEDSLFGTTQAIGSSILSLSEVLREMKPDIFVVYADRFEGFSAMITSTQMNIPTAHIEGGDLTEGGALDDSVRHAMTKLAHIHFATNEGAVERIKRLGEEEYRVINSGFPTVDLIKQGIYTQPDALVKKYNLDLNRPIVLFTQHSVTTLFEDAEKQVMPSLKALDRLANEGYQIIITYPNNDAGAQQIINTINEIANNSKNIQAHKSLGRSDYHGMLNVCGNLSRGCCAGNSSSGIKETPALNCPTVDIGSRQKGRLRASNVIDAGYDIEEIYNAIKKCVENDQFRKECAEGDNPYGKGNSGKIIVDTLATIPINTALLQKQMTY